MNEAELRQHLADAHLQLLDRDNAFRFHEEELRNRDLQIEQLREELARIQVWAGELERSIREMEATKAWRFATRLRSMRNAPRRLLGRDPRP